MLRKNNKSQLFFKIKYTGFLIVSDHFALFVVAFNNICAFCSCFQSCFALFVVVYRLNYLKFKAKKTAQTRRKTNKKKEQTRYLMVRVYSTQRRAENKFICRF